MLEEFGAGAIPFACGRADPGPDGRRFPDEWRLNADEGWGMVMPPQSNTGAAEDAATLLTRAVDESPSSPTVVALGPWTNLEDAVIADPTVADRIAAIHAMGGAIDVPGNVIVDDVTADDGLEWNLAADPSAVSAIFDTATPISLVPLDATDDVPIPPDLAERLAEHRPTAGADLVFELLARVPTRLTGEGQQLWDELAALTVELTGPRDLGGRAAAGRRDRARQPAGRRPAGALRDRRGSRGGRDRARRGAGRRRRSGDPVRACRPAHGPLGWRRPAPSRCPAA